MTLLLAPSLIRDAQGGDAVALGALARQIRPTVERQIARYPVSQEDRRDLLQRVLMRVVGKLSSFRGDASFASWLFRVTENESLMLMRSIRRHRGRLVEGLEMNELEALVAADAEHEVIAKVMAAERDARVRDALDAILPAYKSVVFAHYQLDLGLEQIARRLNISESAVRSRLHRARSRLREVLGTDREDTLGG